MTACPCCFVPLSDASARWQCETDSCQVADPLAQSWLGPSARIGSAVEWRRPPGHKAGPPPIGPCPTCGSRLRPACVACHFVLPADWIGSTTVTVAMAGARNTGKSVYIGVLPRFLGEVVGQLGGSLSFPHQRSQQLYRTVYESALFAATAAVGGSMTEGRIIGPTPKASTGDSYQRYPLIVSLGTLERQQVFLVIRDVAGEDLESYAGGGDSQDANLTFFRHADLVVYLFDPLTVPFVADALSGIIPTQMQVGVRNPVDVLTTVLQLIHPGSPHLAVVMSKFDAVQELRRVPTIRLGRVFGSPGSAMVRNPALSAGVFDLQDSLLLHEEIRGLLMEVAAVDLIKLSERHPHRFMGLSSLGDSPQGVSLSPLGISPFRILDPIMWILAERKLIRQR